MSHKVREHETHEKEFRLEAMTPPVVVICRIRFESPQGGTTVHIQSEACLVAQVAHIASYVVIGSLHLLNRLVELSRGTSFWSSSFVYYVDV